MSVKRIWNGIGSLKSPLVEKTSKYLPAKKKTLSLWDRALWPVAFSNNETGHGLVLFSRMYNALVFLFFFLVTLTILMTTTAYSLEIHKAVSSGNLDTVRSIIASHPEMLEAKDVGGATPLISVAMSVRDGDALGGVVEFLLAQGANVEAKNLGVTPLCAAVLLGHMHTAKLLMANKADTNAKCTIAELMIAPGFVDAYFKAGHKMNRYEGSVIMRNTTLTPLFLAAMLGDVNMAEELLENGADVNAKSSEGSSPLHFASRKGETIMVELLVKNGANINAKARTGDTPLSLSTKLGNSNVAAFLRQNGAQQGTGPVRK